MKTSTFQSIYGENVTLVGPPQLLHLGGSSSLVVSGACVTPEVALEVITNYFDGQDGEIDWRTVPAYVDLFGRVHGGPEWDQWEYLFGPSLRFDSNYEYSVFSGDRWILVNPVSVQEGREMHSHCIYRRRKLPAEPSRDDLPVVAPPRGVISQVQTREGRIVNIADDGAPSICFYSLTERSDWWFTYGKSNTGYKKDDIVNIIGPLKLVPGEEAE